MPVGSDARVRASDAEVVMGADGPALRRRGGGTISLHRGVLVVWRVGAEQRVRAVDAAAVVQRLGGVTDGTGGRPAATADATTAPRKTRQPARRRVPLARHVLAARRAGRSLEGARLTVSYDRETGAFSVDDRAAGGADPASTRATRPRDARPPVGRRPAARTAVTRGRR